MSKAKYLLSDNELRILSVVVFNQGCTVSEMLDLLGENYGMYPSNSYANKLLDNLINKNVLKIDVLRAKEDTEKRISYIRSRRYLSVNDKNINIYNIIKNNQNFTNPYIFFINVKQCPEYRLS